VFGGILFNKPYRIVRKVVIGIIGASVLVIGAAMILLPGPAILVIPAGLAILATEFAWARTVFRKLKEKTGWKSAAE
jgi:tellurite resistance protein TerC